jgi:signal transduction histidine kinase
MYKEHNRMAAMTLINFKLHPSFIHSAIKDQASGIDKAIAELVMNSLDAGATRVDIHVNEIDEKYHFTIKDNGKGFTQQLKITLLGSVLLMMRVMQFLGNFVSAEVKFLTMLQRNGSAINSP